MPRYVVPATTALFPMNDAVPTYYWDVWVDMTADPPDVAGSKGIVPFSLGAKKKDTYIDMLPQKPTAVWIAPFPKGWIGAWHENARPQWIIPKRWLP